MHLGRAAPALHAPSVAHGHGSVKHYNPFQENIFSLKTEQPDVISPSVRMRDCARIGTMD
jgi:hypothetical protein